MNDYIKPNWPTPENVKAYTSTHKGGISKPPYDSFNFSLKTGDNPNAVLTNRKILSQKLNLPKEPIWLKQEHTDIVLHLNKNSQPTETPADASFTTDNGVVCVVLTADCVPILVCDQAGTIVAAIHAGWKGIAKGVIASTIKAMDIDPSNLLAWLGPAIGPNSFEVGHDFYETFLTQDPETKEAFVKHKDRFLANIYFLASLSLKKAGINKIYGGGFCTFTQEDLFYSYRRDGEKTGRMASLIWLRT